MGNGGVVPRFLNIRTRRRLSGQLSFRRKSTGYKLIFHRYEPELGAGIALSV